MNKKITNEPYLIQAEFMIDQPSKNLVNEFLWIARTSLSFKQFFITTEPKKLKKLTRKEPTNKR